MKAADLFDLSGQVALVTGASSGLGLRFAEVLAANGAAVVLVARRVERLEAAQQKIAAAGGRAIAVPADVTDRAAMVRAFESAEQAFGTVTILVNNAGIASAGRAVNMPADDWERVIGIDLDAVFYWAQEAARRMLAAKSRGAIVNIASILGLSAAKGVIAYATAKAGVIQLTKTLAVELGFKGIRVNAIAPGFIPTEMNQGYLLSDLGKGMIRDIPIGRFGDPQDLDGALLLLASDAGRYITGTTLFVDGGIAGVLRG